MSVTSYIITANGYAKGASYVSNRLNHFGNGVALGGGVFLTAAHLFDYYLNDYYDSEFKADAQTVALPQTVEGTVASAPVYLRPYDPIVTKVGHNSMNAPFNDLAFVKSNMPTDASQLSPVVAFASQDDASKFLGGRPTSIASTTTDNGNAGYSLSVPADGQFLTSITSVDGDSGSAAVISLNSNNPVSYVDGILSGSTSQTHQTVFSYLSLSNLYTALNAAGPQDYSGLPPDLLIGYDPNEYFRGTKRKADIITNGSDDVILAGSNGDLVNTGTGQGDVVFLPSAVGQADNGTTIVVSPGSKTIVGGTANDRLVVPVDRLADPNGTDPADSSVTDSSDTITLAGGVYWYTADTGSDPVQTSLVASPSGADQSSNASFNTGLFSNPSIGPYSYNVSYNLQSNDTGGSDLSIDFRSGSWSSSVLLKDFHDGDYGLQFYKAPVSNNDLGVEFWEGIDAENQFVLQHLPTVHTGTYDDDPTQSWAGQGNSGGSASSASDLKVDLLKVIANTQGSSFSGTDAPPPGDQTVSGDNTTASLAAGATATVTGNYDTLNAAGPGSTVNFGGDQDIASIDSGTVNLWNGAAAAVMGNNDTVTLYADGTAYLSGTQNVVDVADIGNAIGADFASVNLWDNSNAALTGDGNSIALNANTSLTLSGAGNAVAVSGTGNSIELSSGAAQVDLWDGASATVSGDGSTTVLNSNNVLTSDCYSDDLTVNGSNNDITMWDGYATAGIAGTNNDLSVSSGTVNFWDGSGGSVTGDGNTLTLYNNVQATATGANDTANLAGTGSSLSIGSASVNLWDNSGGTVSGDANSFTLYSNTALTATGAGDTVNLAGTGAQVAIGAGAVNVWDGAGGTVTGDNNTLVLNNNDTVTAAGANEGITVQGTGDTIAANGSSIGLGDGLTTTVNGSNNTLTLYGSENLTASGTNDAFVFQPAPGTSTVQGVDGSDTFRFSQSTFANWGQFLSQATQSGADTVIKTDPQNTITLKDVALTNLNQSHFQFV